MASTPAIVCWSSADWSGQGWMFVGPCRSKALTIHSRQAGYSAGGMATGGPHARVCSNLLDQPGVDRPGTGSVTIAREEHFAIADAVDMSHPTRFDHRDETRVPPDQSLPRLAWRESATRP